MEKNTLNESVWSGFTNIYSLSKTLRFELRPVGKDGKRLSPEDAKKLFSKIIEQDKKIKGAYVALKPILDKIHEQVINESLNSEEVKKINFSEYYGAYKQKKELKSREDALRTEFSRFILSHGRRLQYSVYEINNSKRILELVEIEIKDRFEKRFDQGDNVLIFKITNEKHIIRYGYAKNEETDLVMY
ncbi:hypothetical protein JXB31_01090 [Candidatus Woesearchaeota archaeon]|nr:hypothetical protein [Candidatus Woesearchaeota archaeon]